MGRFSKWLMALGFLAFILWVIVLANRGEVGQWFGFIRYLPYGDKLGHMVLYGTLALMLNWALGWRALRWGHWAQWGSLAVALFAVAEEMAQAWNPNRTLDGWDLAADAVGLILATGASVWISRRVESTPGSAQH
ncbi:VanZ family protein [Marinobacter hydrocarbonoclasticus]|nr:VanZ family protein [Marinobacter nauticus]